MPFRYEYKCEEGHVTERIRNYVAMRAPVLCEECESPATLIQSVPARSWAKNYEGGMKIAPWTLPPVRDPKTGEVMRNSDGSIKMQHIEVGSRKEFLEVLKNNGLTELETNSDHLVQGGTFKRDQKAEKDRKFEAEVEEGMKMLSQMKSSESLRKKTLDVAKKKGSRIDEVTSTDQKSLSA